MKTISSLSSKLFALTLALMASVSSFAYEFEYSNDFHIDGFAYKVLPSNTLWPYGAVALIEIADCAADVIIPDTITYTFSNTTVTYIVTTLGGGAALFTNSAKETVKSISIPKGISVINSPLFAGCSNLTSIVVDSENHYYDSRKNCNAIITTAQNPYSTPNTLMAGCKATTIPNSVTEIADKAFYNSAIESITIPTGVTKIGRSAFNKSNQLSSVTLPASLKEIGDWAFADCLSLNTIICYALVPPTVSSYTFQGSNPIYNNPTVYVPAESVEAYKNAEHWKWFLQILPIEQNPEDLFPTLWGLQQTICSGYYGEEGDEWASGLTGPSQEITMMDGKPYLQWGSWYLREENDKILVYSEIQKKDLVLYDFTLELGDTLTTLNLVTPEFLEYEGIVGIVDYPLSDYDYTYPIDTLVVTELSKETLLDGKEYTRWKFSDGTVYVEGIGSMSETFFHHIADHLPVPVSYLGSYLVCVSKNGQLLYQMDDAEMERLGAECLCEIETSYKDQWCDTWNVMWFDGMRFDETASTTKYRLGKDTIIGDYTYSKFTSSTSVRFTDDRKVYVYYEGFDDNDPYTEDLPTGEYLAYDFSAQVGDTLEVFSKRGWYSTCPCVVSDVQINSETNLRTIKLYPLGVVDSEGNIGIFGQEITWIEGVGSPSGFLFDDPKPGGGLFTLLCAYQDDELKYTGSFYERFGCDYNAGVISEDLFPTLSGLQRTICREYCEQADNKTRIEQFTNLTTRTETSGPYLYCSPFLLREKDNKILIYSRSLNKDLVLYDFNLQVGDSLPMLYIDFFAKDDWGADRDMEIWCVVDYYKDLEGNILPADTLIVTDVSAITLLDGKEYKKWTFDNGMEYVEGIGSFGNRQWSGDFFQLIGNMDIPVSLHGEHLVCASRNGKLLYQMDDAEMERLGAECLCDVEKKWSDTWCDTWNIFVENGSVYPPHEETYRYQLAKDTVIGEHTYTAVVSKAINDALDAPRYVAAVRFTDDRKVYIYYDNAEYLLYDFNVQEGDELEVFAGINNYISEIKTYKCTVTGVEQYACVGCPATITLEVHNHPDDFREFYRQTQWIEGVGDINGFLNGINGYINIPGNAAEYLLCAYQGDELKYTGDLYEEYGCGDNAEQSPADLFPTLWGLQRTSCTKTIGEDEEGTVWGSRSYLMQEIETATIDGKQYLLFGTNNIYDEYCSLWLREENNKILLYSTAQKKDLVLYDFTLNVGDLLPRLYVDYDLSSVVDYDNDEWGLSPLVVTEVSTITLLDGKEYKKWTFDNGMQYVEGIGSFGTCYAHNDFYQLIANAPLTSDVYSQQIVCVSKNGQLLYQMDASEMEQLETECLCEIEPKWSETWCNQWNILSHGYLGPQDPLAGARTSIYWLSNNTVNRSGQEYIPLMCSSSMPNEESTLLVGELRFTEDKQVYFNYDNTEYLLYDFDVQVGDTLDIFGGIELYSYSFVEQKTYPHVITKIDTLDDGRLQITSDAIVIFEDSYGAFEEKMPQTWIEGLGSTNGIVYTSINPGIDGDAAIVMLCAYRDDECVYKTDSNNPYWIDYTQLGCVYNEGDFIEGAFPILSGLQRTVCNEYCGETEDDNSANNTYKQTFDSIFFENDKPYILCNGYLLREEENKILIYSQILNKDLVLYDFTLEVGDSLPALYIDYQQHNAMDWMPYNIGVVDYNIDHGGTIYPADTFVVTNISTVTLLDGKEYKKWTFNNGMEYVEGIGMYGGHRNGDFFRLIHEIIVPCNPGTHLVCVSKNGQLLYQMDDAEMERLGAECLCDYDSGPRHDNAKNGKIGGRPTPTQWNMLEVETKEMDGTSIVLRAETFSYTLENDSIIANGKTFYQLARQSTKDTATTKSVVGALHFGEDEDNRVYFYHDGAEYVLYDFTADPGDTLQLFAGINNYPQHTTYTHVVVDKDTTEDGACRMFLEVVFPEGTTPVENAEKVWLAGLGSIDGIVHNAAKQANDVHAAPSRSTGSSDKQTSVMLCAWREDSCLYTTNHPDYDTFGCVYNTDEMTAIEDTHSPSPIADYQKLLHNGQLLIIHNGKTYNVLGVNIR